MNFPNIFDHLIRTLCIYVHCAMRIKTVYFTGYRTFLRTKNVLNSLKLRADSTTYFISTKLEEILLASVNYGRIISGVDLKWGHEHYLRVPSFFMIR